MSDLPDGWALGAIEDCSAIEPGAITDGPYGSNLKTAHYTAEGPLVIRLGNIAPRHLNLDDKAHVSPEHFSSLQRHHVKPGDVVIAALGDPIGRACIVPQGIGEAMVKADCFRLRPGSHIDPRFLVWWFNSTEARDAFLAVSHGMGRIRVNLSDVKRSTIPLPPLPEQRRIVAKLDRLSARSRAARDHLVRTTTLAARAKQAILKSTFSPTEEPERELQEKSCTLADLGHWSSGGTPRSKNADFYGGDIPWIRSGDLPDKAITSHEVTISQAGLDNSSAKWISSGCVLIAMYGATIGKLGVTTYPVTTNQAVACLKPNASVTPWWAFFMLLSIRPDLIAIGQGGAQPNISQTILKRWPVSLPTIEQQERQVTFIESAFARIDRLTEEAGRAAHLLDRLDERLLTRAFRGELVPQDPADEPAAHLLARIRAARAAAPKPTRRRRAKA